MKYHSISVYLLFVIHFLTIWARPQVHVVYFGGHNGERTLREIEDSHHSYLLSVKISAEEARASLVHSYKNVINGFSALLTPEEASQLSKMNEVVSVFKCQPRYIAHTTRSWDFINLLQGEGDADLGNNKGEELLHKANYGKDVIVGVFDSGVWPESQSFSDEGLDSIPNKWKGVCQSGVSFNSSHCNRKLIGARYYLKGYEAYHGSLDENNEYRSPRDKNGHGTHTASTAAGRKVPNASVQGGFGNGTASGGASLARLAIYKVCWRRPGAEDGCTVFDSDMLEAFDDAIADGVDLISVSLGQKKLRSHADDAIAMGSFHAAKRGILVACSAGNNGPDASSVNNVAPWVITVAASSIDREFPAPVLLGNNLKLEGRTVTPYSLEQMHPLVYAGDVEVLDSTNSNTKGKCLEGTLSDEHVRGKIVLCRSGRSDKVEKGLEVKRAGGVGMVIRSRVSGISASVDAHVLPATALFKNESNIILDYIEKSGNPMATILQATTVLGSKPAPFVANFSSRGPNGLEPNILKPDITAPGLNILASWSEGFSYNIISGTSMSCPHVTGAAALLKAIHPDWSSAAIKSALMTTARISNNMGSPITDALGYPAGPFEYGSGHIQPSKAADPGLVYDATYNDYLLYLCNSGNRLDPNFQCPKTYPSPSNLNYPSLSISMFNTPLNVTRTVTNVARGNSGSVYKCTIEAPPGYTVEIFPSVLSFGFYGEKKSFDVVIKVETGSVKEVHSFGSFTWSDGIHSVRSPIVVSSM